MKAIGQIVEVRREKALVYVGRALPCAGCGSSSACGLLGLFAPEERFLTEVDIACGAQPGEQVELRVERGGIVGLAGLVYLLPGTAALLGAILGSALGPELLDWNADLGAMVGLGVLVTASFVLLRVIHPRLTRCRTLRVSAVAVVGASGSHVGSEA